MSTPETLALIARHPVVQLHFEGEAARWSFARFYIARQAQSETLLSLIETIELYRCPYLEVKV